MSPTDGELTVLI